MKEGQRNIFHMAADSFMVAQSMLALSASWSLCSIDPSLHSLSMCKDCFDVLCRMKEGQKDIFYMAADSLESAQSAPFVERLVEKDFEVQ